MTSKLWTVVTVGVLAVGASANGSSTSASREDVIQTAIDRGAQWPSGIAPGNLYVIHFPGQRSSSLFKSFALVSATSRAEVEALFRNAWLAIAPDDRRFVDTEPPRFDIIAECAGPNWGAVINGGSMGWACGAKSPADALGAALRECQSRSGQCEGGGLFLTVGHSGAAPKAISYQGGSYGRAYWLAFGASNVVPNRGPSSVSVRDGLAKIGLTCGDRPYDRPCWTTSRNAYCIFNTPENQISTCVDKTFTAAGLVDESPVYAKYNPTANQVVAACRAEWNRIRDGVGGAGQAGALCASVSARVAMSEADLQRLLDNPAADLNAATAAFYTCATTNILNARAGSVTRPDVVLNPICDPDVPNGATPPLPRPAPARTVAPVPTPAPTPSVTPRPTPVPSPAPAPSPTVPHATPRTNTAIDDVLADLLGTTEVKPEWRENNQRARINYQQREEALRKGRFLHHNANDATQCLKVEATGVKSEWGIQGRFRILNICNYPVDASWCANAKECEGSPATGNLWTIFPGGDWPIFFADPTNPSIQVGGCRIEKESVPWPSDAAINRAGGVSEAHNPPVPAAGVSIMPRHICK